MHYTTIPFDSQNHNWTGNRENDYMLLRAMENNINDILKHRGYIYLNQIYELLGCSWDPDVRNPCIKTIVVGKPPYVQLSALFEPNGTLSGVAIIRFP